MNLFAKGDTVKLNPAVLEDETLKRNHHLLARMLKEDKPGVIVEQDLNKSTPKAFYYWVKFSFFSILLSEFYIMKASV